MTPVGVIRPMSGLERRPGANSLNQTFVSGPAVILSTKRVCGIVGLLGSKMAGTGKIVSEPEGVIRPMLVPAANQRLPSGPAVMLEGRVAMAGRVNSVMSPAGVIRPIASDSVNQRLWSGPATMLLAPETGNSVRRPAVVTRPIAVRSV